MRNINRSAAVRFVFLSFLLVFLSVLPACGGETEAPVDHEATSSDLPEVLKERTTWYGIYIRGQKAGWSRSEIQHIGADEPGDIRMLQETMMKVGMLGTVQTIHSHFSLDFTRDLKPVRFVFDLDNPAAAMKIEGRVVEDELILTTTSASGSREERIPIDDELDLFGLDEIRRSVEGYSVGDVFEGKIFMPGLTGVVEYRVEVTDSELIRTGVTTEKVYHVRGSMGPITQNSIVSENGEVIKVETSMDISYLRESEEDAKNLGSTANVTDLVLAFSIPVKIDVPDVTQLERVVLRVSGLRGYKLQSGGFQTVEPGSDTNTMLVTVSNRASDLADDSAEFDRKKFLESTTYIQADDPDVIKKAAEVIGDAATQKEKVDRLAKWVYDNVKKEAAFTFPSTIEVLKTMRGDCNEHAALFVGLARAAGIPTRVAAGLGYLDGRMYYHAWNEVWLDGRWLPIDTTFGENPASVMHLRVVTGDLTDQMIIAGLAGHLKIDVLEAK